MLLSPQLLNIQGTVPSDHQFSWTVGHRKENDEKMRKAICFTRIIFRYILPLGYSNEINTTPRSTVHLTRKKPTFPQLFTKFPAFYGNLICYCRHKSRTLTSSLGPISPLHTFPFYFFNPYPTAFPYGNGIVLHFYQQQESSTTKTVHKVINKGLKTYV